MLGRVWQEKRKSWLRERLSLLEIERNSEAESGHDPDLVPWPEKPH